MPFDDTSAATRPASLLAALCAAVESPHPARDGGFDPDAQVWQDAADNVPPPPSKPSSQDGIRR